MTAGHLALIVAAVFSGAAIYVNVVEQPARFGLEDRALLAEWKPSYKRGTMMQAPLALAGFALGLVAWWQTRDLLFLAGGIAMLANWPWTIFVINPVNAILNGHRTGTRRRTNESVNCEMGMAARCPDGLRLRRGACFFCCLPFALTPNHERIDGTTTQRETQEL